MNLHIIGQMAVSGALMGLIYALIACITPIGLLLARPWLLKHKAARGGGATAA